MKRSILIIFSVFCLTSCEKMIAAAVDLFTPDPQLSFQANGEVFKVTDRNTKTLRISNFNNEGFAITFSGGSYWDTENTLYSVVISLNCGIFDGTLEKGVEYRYTAEDLDTYPCFKYSIHENIESTAGGESYDVMTMWYNATEGWIKINKINKKKGLISGSFEFTAVCDDPSNGDVIEITKGVFKDITYKTFED